MSSAKKMSIKEQRSKASDLSLGSSHSVIYDRALAIVKEFARPDESILDFGAGQGTFVKLLESCEAWGEIHGVDLMAAPEGLAESTQWAVQDLNDPLETLPRVNIVTALEVIEHLENPRHMLRQIHSILKPGGLALVSTPNNESLRSLLSYFFRGHFVDFTGASYPAHITALNRQDIARAARESGFKVSAVDFTDHGCVPGMTSLTWQQISFGLARGLRFSDNFFTLLKKSD